MTTPGCTGFTARWCPIHGDCRCGETDPDGEGNRSEHWDGPMSDPRCPLHSPSSTHAEPLGSLGPATRTRTGGTT